MENENENQKKRKRRAMTDAEKEKAAARLPSMSFAEKQARTQTNRLLVLDFLASGEVYATVEFFQSLLQCSQRTAGRALTKLIRSEALVSRTIQPEHGRSRIVYGITGHGLALAGKIGNPSLEPYTTVAPELLDHKTMGQLARLIGEAHGWTGWEPERLIKIREFAGTNGGGKQSRNKIPDYLAKAPDGAIVAVEIERTVKTPGRYASIMAHHILAMKAGKWSRVIYICPDVLRDSVQAAFARVETLRHAGESVPVTDKHRSRFRFVTFSQWQKGEF